MSAVVEEHAKECLERFNRASGKVTGTTGRRGQLSPRGGLRLNMLYLIMKRKKMGGGRSRLGDQSEKFVPGGHLGYSFARADEGIKNLNPLGGSRLQRITQLR